ncbi:hypothetical protein chiPu_0028501, partial [Chiloscyllium punctatum]|nr:hypothetical protein [Chiloscyllium punctatum]
GTVRRDGLWGRAAAGAAPPGDLEQEARGRGPGASAIQDGRGAAALAAGQPAPLGPALHGPRERHRDRRGQLPV